MPEKHTITSASMGHVVLQSCVRQLGWKHAATGDEVWLLRLSGAQGMNNAPHSTGSTSLYSGHCCVLGSHFEEPHQRSAVSAQASGYVTVIAQYVLTPSSGSRCLWPYSTVTCLNPV